MRIWSEVLVVAACLCMAALTEGAAPRKSKGGTPFKENNPGTTCPCGNSKKGRIVGGKVADDNQYPWIVMFVFTEHLLPFCGASIINEKVAITAAHCTHDSLDDALSIIAGTSDARIPGQIIAVEKIVEHEDYEYPPGYARRIRNDIALLFLESPLKFNENTGPICLPHGKMDIDEKWIKFLGWGKMGGNAKSSYNLLEVDVKSVPYEKCKSEFWEDMDTPQTQICGQISGKGGCKGDSGGPVVYLDPKINRYILVGLVSFGNNDCNTSVPTVATEVSEYLPWIKSKINTLGCQAIKSEEEKKDEEKKKEEKKKDEKKIEEKKKEEKTHKEKGSIGDKIENAQKGRVKGQRGKEKVKKENDKNGDKKKVNEESKEVETKNEGIENAEKELKEAEKDLKDAEKELKVAENQVKMAEKNKEGPKKIVEKVKEVKEKAKKVQEKANIVREKAKNVHQKAVKAR